MSCSEAIVETRQLSKGYGRRRGIADVNFSLTPGRIYGFLGPNGAGKTTTIRILLGFLQAASGSAQLFGLDAWRSSAEIKLRVGYVPGDVRFYPWMTTRRALQISQATRQQPLIAQGLRLCELFTLDPDLPVRKMSRGNRQKVALVAALAHEPDLLILDEPTSGLDPVVQATLMDQLRRFSRAGRTVLFSSHTLSEVEELCDQILMIREGQLILNESLSELKSRAPRSIRIDFERPLMLDLKDLPNHVQLVRREPTAMWLTLAGEAAEVVQWAATLPVRDVSISPPSLEILFRRFYLPDQEPWTGQGS